MSLTLLLKRRKNERRERKGKKKEKKLRVHYGHPKDGGLAANVNDSMDAGGMAAADVTQASEPAKSRELFTKHWRRSRKPAATRSTWRESCRCVRKRGQGGCEGEASPPPER